MTTTVKLFALAFFAASLASCGGSPKVQPAPAVTPAAEAAPAAMQDPAQVRAEIERLDQDIRELRAKAGLPAEPAVSAPDTTEAEPMGEVESGGADQTERCEASGGSCGDTCQLRSTICDNADSICRLAADLAGDSWAQNKCQSARASCGEAEELCCKCASGG
jgi:hypothetical protein